MFTIFFTKTLLCFKLDLFDRRA